jgi:peptidoglycan L-alanyl-D-glutamate endopeptidase CwlK
MAEFSKRSATFLAECEPDLQLVFNYVIGVVDCTIITGHRDKYTQNELYRNAGSQLQYPDSKHNSLPSRAVDAAPYPIDWQDRERATLFAGFVMGAADVLGVKLRWGGDWDADWQVKDNGFDDLWHFELV